MSGDRRPSPEKRLPIGNSRPVSSGQEGVHHDLERTVRRHLAAPFRRPLGEASRIAVDAALAARAGRPLVLDAGCGVGESTAVLGEVHPQAFVLGIDKSADRLSRARPLPGNARVIRADLVDAWRHLRALGIRLERHYLLYPNPWPKIGQLSRRWHGHPVFPELLALGGVLELRSNWRIYVDEFREAARLARGEAGLGAVEVWPAAEPITPFERKYRASGQCLYRVLIDP